MVGIVDEVAGEVPKAFIARSEGSNITEKEIIKYVESM